MTTYALNIPEQPPIGSEIIDIRGYIWKRSKNGWTNKGAFVAFSWKRLLDYGPLTLKEPEPKQGDIKVHQGNNNWFVIFIDGKWIEYHIYSDHKAAILESEPNMDKFE